MAIFELLMLAFFMSITCNGNAVTQTSEFKCRIPDSSSIDDSMNVHVNQSEEEFELLQIEGRCFLYCAKAIYSNEVNIRIEMLWLSIYVSTHLSEQFNYYS